MTHADDVLREMRRQNAVVMYGLAGPDRRVPGTAELDSVTTTLAHFLRVDYAGVHVLDGDEQVTLAASDPAPAPPVPRSRSLCSTVLDHRGDADVVVVPDTADVTWLQDNPFVTGGRHPVRLYAAAPLRTRTGVALGTLCVAAPEPRDLDGWERALLLHLAAAVVHILERGRVLPPAPGG